MFCVFKNANAQVIPYGANFRPVSLLDNFSIKYLPSKEMNQVFANKKGAELPVHRTYSVEKANTKFGTRFLQKLKKLKSPTWQNFYFIC